MAPYIPGRCLRCGAEVAGQGGIYVESAVGVTLSDNHTTCPRCGGPVQLLEGRMNVRDGGIEMLAGPQWSWDLVDSLGLALRHALEDPGSNVQQAVEAVDPVFGRAMDTAVTEGVRKRGKALTPAKKRVAARRLASGIVGLLLIDYDVSVDNAAVVGQMVMATLSWFAQFGALPPTG